MQMSQVESEIAEKQSGDLDRGRELKMMAESLKLETFINIQLNDLLLNGEAFIEASNPKN